jgi:hypothetical protein
MTLPIPNHRNFSRTHDRLLDQLVDGELSERERSELLRRFETEADGWRRCALAFLEAQSWREAFGPVVAPLSARPGVPRALIRARKRWPPVARLTGLAAGIAAAFAIGWALHRQPEIATRSAPVAQGAAARATADSAQQPDSQNLAIHTGAASKPAESSSLVTQWRQRGYQAETQKQLVSVDLKDGRKVRLPVHEVRLRYVGDRTY